MVTFLSRPGLFVVMSVAMSSHHEEVTREHQGEKHEERGIAVYAQDG
jgi:hypothetical protein